MIENVKFFVNALDGEQINSDDTLIERELLPSLMLYSLKKINKSSRDIIMKRINKIIEKKKNKERRRKRPESFVNAFKQGFNNYICINFSSIY